MIDTMSINKIVNFWSGKLVKVPPSELEIIDFHSNTKRFLIEIGLPKSSKILNDALCINFYSTPQLYVNSSNTENYLIFGDDFGTKLSINSKTGEIFSIDFEDKSGLNFSFINSNINSFLRFLIIFIEFQKIASIIDNENYKLVERMKEKFLEVDKKSLENSTNWWSIIVNQP